jgi:putative membrane protein
MTSAGRHNTIWHAVLAGGVGVVLLVAVSVAYIAIGPRAGFLGHMIVHVVNLGLAAPLVALALALALLRAPVRSPSTWVGAALPAIGAVLELIVVWVWHTPVLHILAREKPAVFALEQVTVLVAGALLWWAAWRAVIAGDRSAIGVSVLALLMTSMHMTLLGAIFAFADRALFEAPGSFLMTICGQTPIADQHTGAAVMLGFLGVIYLAAGLGFAAALLHARQTPVANKLGTEATLSR